MLLQQYQPALQVQLFHLLMCVTWNAIGVYQLSQGLQPIGPVASVAAIVVMSLLAALLIGLLINGKEKFYILVGVLPALAALMTIVGAFTNDPSNWPSEFWRWAGVAVNIIGIAGFALVMKNFVKMDEIS